MTRKSTSSFLSFCSQTNFCDYSGEAQLRLRQSWNQGGVSILGRLPTPQTDLVVGFENAQIQWRGNPLLFVLLDDLREKAQFVTWLFETVNLFSPFLAACTNRSNATQNLVRGVVSWTQRKCSTREGPWGGIKILITILESKTFPGSIILPCFSWIYLQMHWRLQSSCFHLPNTQTFLRSTKKSIFMFIVIRNRESRQRQNECQNLRASK